MGEGSLSWFRRQWEDISGNAKFALLVTVGVAVIDWIRNGPGWQLLPAIIAFVLALFFLLIGTSRVHKIVGRISLYVSFTIVMVFAGLHLFKKPHEKVLANVANSSPAIQVNTSNFQGVAGPVSGTVNFGTVINNLPSEPLLAVYPYAYPEPKEPFDTDFVLENRSPFWIRGITCNFQVPKVVLKNGLEPTNLKFPGIAVSDLSPGGQAWLHSQNTHDIVGGGAIISGELAITVEFSDPHQPDKKTRRFLFFTKPQSDRRLLWYPMGNN